MLGRFCGLGGLLLELYCLGPALGRRCALEARLELCCLADERRRLLLSMVCLRVVTLRRILSPHALVPKVSIIMPDWLIELFALLLPPMPVSPVKDGLAGGGLAFSRAAAKCQSGWMLACEGDGAGCAGDNCGELWRDPRVGEPVGVVWMELLR